MIRWALLALGVGALPLLSAGVHPGHEVVSAHGDEDALLQTALLQNALDHAPWSEDFWHPPFFWPERWQTVTMDPLVGQAALLKLVWWGAGTRPAFDANLLMVLTLALGFLVVVGWTRDWGASPFAAGVAGAVYVLGPFAAGQWHHLNQLPSPWLPLALWSLVRLHRARGRAWVGWTALLAVAFVWQLVSSIYVTATLVLGLAVFAPFFVVRDRRGAGAWALVAVVAVAAATLWAQPFLEATRAVEGYGRDAADVGPFQARYFDLAKAPSSHLMGWPEHDPTRPALYPGLLWLVLAGAGAVSRWREGRRRQAGALIVAAGAGLLFSFGRSHPGPGGELGLPFAWLQDALPPLRALRDPSRFFLLSHLALALAAAWGLDALTRRARWWPWAWAVVALALVDLAPGRTPSVRVTPDAAEAPVLRWLAERPEPTVWMPLPAPCREMDESAFDARAVGWALATGAPVAGGSSGFLPPSIQRLRESCCDGLDAQALRALADHGVDAVVVERDRRRRWPPALESAPPRVRTPRLDLYLREDLEWALFAGEAEDSLAP